MPTNPGSDRLASAPPAAIAATVPPLTSTQLRTLVTEACGLATLTCTFLPGGRLHGVGIRSHFYCETCGQSRLWHEVAAAAVTVAWAEDIVRTAGAPRPQKDEERS